LTLLFPLVLSLLLLHALPFLPKRSRLFGIDGPREVTPDRCWHGSFYYNPDDPALFVEARTGFGYAGNSARPLSWLLAALMFLFPLGLFLRGRKLFG
jgi:uncharacterized membrane protein